MTKIYYDGIELERLVTPSLDSAIINIKKSIELIKSLSVPYEFKYRNYLKSLDENIKINLNEVTNICNIIDNSHKTFSRINSEQSKNISSINNYNISLRQSAIK